jgi:hypothetical protein
MAHPGRILAIATLLALLALVPTAASAAALVPFQATVFEHYTLSFCGRATVCIDAHGMGQATHLGEVSESSTVRVDVNPADAVSGCSPETRSTVLTAANGDEIMMSATGWGCPATNSAHDSYVVTGGTGRFQGATGSGTDSNIHTLTGPGVGVAVTTFSGELSSPGSLASPR